MSEGAVNVGVYGEIDMNLIDGSSVWLQSIALTLARIPGVEVTVLLRTPSRRGLLVAPLREHANITVVDPVERGLAVARMDAAGAATVLRELDDEHKMDRLLLRGDAVADAIAQDGGFEGRIWLYHVPIHGSDPAAQAPELRRRVAGADRVLCQTEAIAAVVTAAAPALADRILLLPPMIPDELAAADEQVGPMRRLVYAGKFSPGYAFLEMVSLFETLREHIPELEWDVAGDKIHNPPDDPAFRGAAERALRDTPGLCWHGAVARERVRTIVQQADLALSLRHSDMDASTELSTKILEYGAAGCPVLLNRNRVHVDLLGTDYPLLAGNLDEARQRTLSAAAEPELRLEARRRCLDAASRHTFSEVAKLLAPHLQPTRGRPPGAIVNPDGTPRLLLAGHQFNFLGEIRSYAIARGAAVREDRWLKHVVHDEPATAEAVNWAQVILCEWCLGAAIWCSRNRRDDQRLVVRFHRMELETPYPGEVDLARVNTMVFVAPHVLEAACRQYGWSPDDPVFRVVPNAINCARFALEKLPAAPFTLGMVGWVPMLKRLDRALDILTRLRARDERFRLIVKGNAPWDYYWMAARESERRFYEQALARVERSPLLRSAVTFEPFGTDVAPFLQKIGWLLSVSNIEGHAVAPAEAMASGAVPVVIERPGAREQYPSEWVHSDAEQAARAILEVSASGRLSAEQDRARHLAAELDWKQLAPLWSELLELGGR